MTPNVSLIQDLIKSPNRFVDKSKSDFVYNYYLYLIEAIAFKYNKIKRLLNLFDY